MRDRIFKLAVLGIVLATIGCDRATKRLAIEHLANRPSQHLLADTVRLQFVENRGGFLGLGSGLSERDRVMVFVIGTGLLLVGVLVTALRRGVRGTALAGLGLLWAGGISNLVDRLARGSVVDFLNVGVGPLRTGIFNVADVAIMVGCALIVVRAAAASPSPRAVDGPPSA